MLVVMDKSTHKEQLSQTLKTKFKQIKLPVIFLTGYNGIFNNIIKKQFLFRKINH